MAAYAEGLNVLAKANIGAIDHEVDAETAPLEAAEYYQYDIDLPKVTEVWRRGSVITSWLLDLTAEAYHDDPELERLLGPRQRLRRGTLDDQRSHRRGRAGAGAVRCAATSGSRRRGRSDVADQVLSAMRAGFGGHKEKKEIDPMSGAPARRPTPPTSRLGTDQRRINRPPTRSCSSAPPATSPSASCSRRCTGSKRAGALRCPGDRRGPQRLDRRRLPRTRPRVDREAHRRRATPTIIDSLCERLDLVQGDYADEATWNELKATLDRHDSEVAVFYMAIPPSIFPMVAEQARIGRSPPLAAASSSRSRSGATTRPRSS